MSSSPNADTAQRGWLVPLGVAVLAGLGAAGGTFALWNAQDTTEAHLVASGDLEVTGLGDPQWQETSPDVSTAPREIDPATFLVRPGDAVAVTIPFETTLRGDNLATELSVDWSADSTVPAGVTGTYTLVNAQGNDPVAKPVALGQAIDFPAENGGHYEVQVELNFAKITNRIGADEVDPLSDLGDFDIHVQQVRTGGGGS